MQRVSQHSSFHHVSEVPEVRGRAAQERWLSKQQSFAKGKGKGQSSGGAASASSGAAAQPVVEPKRDEDTAHSCWADEAEIDRLHHNALCFELGLQPDDIEEDQVPQECEEEWHDHYPLECEEEWHEDAMPYKKRRRWW